MWSEWWVVFPCDADELDAKEAIELEFATLYLQQLHDFFEATKHHDWIPNPFRRSGDHISVHVEVE